MNLHAIRAADRRPLPTGWLTLTQRSAAMGEHGLTADEFETRQVPLSHLPDREQARVVRWAATHRGAIPATVTVFRVREHLRQPELF